MIVAYNLKGSIGILNYDFLLIKVFNQNHNNGKYVICIFVMHIFMASYMTVSYGHANHAF